MRWFPVAFLTNGVLKVTHGGIELTTPMLSVRMFNHYATAPQCLNIVLSNGALHKVNFKK